MTTWALLTLLAAPPALAQTPWQAWRTIRTEGYVVHYPLVAEPWAVDVAEQLDDVRSRVAAEVGYTPPQRVHVVVLDPYSDANGSAWPFLRRPRLQLWATPPGPDSVIGTYRSWTELLVTHEDTHLVHLLRPSRNGAARWLGRVIGLGPVAIKSPRWVTEGYATVVEARLTGSGRPNGNFRAELLRSLGEEGRLPAYGELNAYDRFMGGSFAYLVGSAYLEWLEERAGPDSLRHLWARLTAKEVRTFDEAFQGIWGAPPDALYARFVAEVTAAAQVHAQDRDADTLFESLSGYPGSPAVSPDGSKLAVIVNDVRSPPKIRVWHTRVDDDAV